MKIVVTGALGHIGSRLIRELPASFPGAEIVLVDNLSTQRYASLFDLPGGARYRFVEADVLDPATARWFDGADAVIHLAAITDAASSIARKNDVERNNLEGTRRVATASAEAKARLVFVSSTSVYGTQKEEVSEECTAEDLKPQSPYAETKLREETCIAELGASRGLRCAILRFGTIFGVSPGMRFHTAVNKFCWQAVMGEPITVWRTALDQVRPYLDLSDAVRAFSFALAGDRFDGRTYNVLTLNATVRAILDAIRRRIPEIETRFVDEAIMNQLSYRVSRRRFEELGFRFEGDLEKGIAETIDLLAGSAGRFRA